MSGYAGSYQQKNKKLELSGLNGVARTLKRENAGHAVGLVAHTVNLAKGATMFLILFLFVFSSITYARDLPIDLIKLPPGFHVDLYASDIANARSMALSSSGVLFVGTRTEGKVYALVDENADNKIDKKYTIAQGLNMPNGVAFRDGSLYVAEVNRILRFDNIEKNLSAPLPPKIVYDQLPSEGHHGWKYLAFGPDGWLYFGVGAPCNVCDKPDPYSSIYRIKPDGSAGEVFARGVRNTVGFDWHPSTKEIWFTDNGRDMMGDDIPPDELNNASKQGEHFGFPYCHGQDIADPDFGKDKNCASMKNPAQTLGAHVAGLGMKFYNKQVFPKEYRNQIFIAEHGSWNRSKKNGYRIMRVKLKGNKAMEYEVFASGWLQEGDKVWGRPVDILVMPDGSMLVSDDYAGAIYRIWYGQGYDKLA